MFHFVECAMGAVRRVTVTLAMLRCMLPDDGPGGRNVLEPYKEVF